MCPPFKESEFFLGINNDEIEDYDIYIYDGRDEVYIK